MYADFADSFASDRSNSVWKEWDYLLPILENLSKNSTIADIGCGNGRLLPYLFKGLGRPFAYKAIDPALPFEKYLLERFTKLPEGYSGEFLEGSFEKIPLEDNSVDLLCGIASFHHVLNTADLQKAIVEIKRILKKDGVVFITVWNLFTPQIILRYQLPITGKSRVFDIPWKGKSGEVHNRKYYGWKEEELVKFFSSNGFEIVESHTDRNIAVSLRIIK